LCIVYNDLPHPPATYLDKKYQWRTADGSCNNVDVPDLGKAGMPYARSVQQSHPLPPNSLPDAGLVFDSLLRREGVSHRSLSLINAADANNIDVHVPARKCNH
jgi:linoleate 10R-lipoxygenase